MPYLPPEVLANKISISLMPGDMWAIGIITYQLLFGKLPYENFDIKNPRNDIIKMQKKFMLCEPQLSHECQDFLQSLLKVDPNTRITADVALQSKWIESGRSIDNKYLKPLYNLSQAKRVTYFQQCILIKMIETYQKEDQCRLEKLFNQINQGKNGLLNKADIVNLYQKVYNNGNVSEDANQVFANLDTDGNNGINFQEFLIATIDKVNLLQDEHLEDTFKLLANPQGFITLKSVLRLITCDEQFLKQEFNEFDSEKINRKKYLEIFQNLIK